MLPTSLRKAAILISALDDRAADALLDQMGAEQAARVRSAIMELDDISKDEQQRVLAEFLQRQSSPALAAASREEAGVELDLAAPEIAGDSPAAELPPGDPAPAPLDTTDRASEVEQSAPTFLFSVTPEALAEALGSEQPQTIAAVLAHIEPERTAIVLQHLPSSLATDALERMATLEPLTPAVLADLENELRARITRQCGPGTLPAESVRRLSAVLGAMDYRQRERVVLQLAERNAALVGRLGLTPTADSLNAADADRITSLRYRIERPDTANDRATRARASHPRLEFSDLATFDDQSLRAVFAAAEPAVVLLALTAADEQLLERVLGQLSARDAAVLRQRLNHPGPIRLREIEQAQRQLVSLAGRLASEGTVRLPSAIRFAASA